MRTPDECDSLIRESQQIRARALSSIEDYLSAIADRRMVYAAEGDRIDALLEERNACPDEIPAEMTESAT